MSLINEDIVARASLTKDDTFVDLNVDLAAGNTTVRTNGRYSGVLTAPAGFCLPLDAIALPRLKYDLILGLDWLRAHEPQVCWRSGALAVAGCTILPTGFVDLDHYVAVAWPSPYRAQFTAQAAAALEPSAPAVFLLPPTSPDSPPPPPASAAVSYVSAAPFSFGAGSLDKTSLAEPATSSPPLSPRCQESQHTLPQPPLLPEPLLLSLSPPAPPFPASALPYHGPRVPEPAVLDDDASALLICDPEFFAALTLQRRIPRLGSQARVASALCATAAVLMSQPKNGYERWVSEFPSVLRDDLPSELPPSRKWDHTLPLLKDAEPFYARARRTSIEEDGWLRKELDELLSRGAIRKSESPFAAPILFVPKKDGTKRFCVDYRGLNARTRRNRYPLPLVDACLDRMRGARFFSKFDLKSGFHQLRIAEKDVFKTAFSTKYGLFEWLVCPFGLADMPATFQRMMNEIFADLIDQGVQIYMDDICIATATLLEHERLTREVLRRLAEHKLVIRPDKCVWCADRVEFLGHLITREGLRPAEDKVGLIRAWPLPTTSTELRGFLGLCNFVRRYIPQYAELTAPLFDLLARPVGSALTLTKSDRKAIEALKQAVQSAATIRIPDQSRPLAIAADASGVASGAVLLQHDGAQWQPCAFTGHKFTQSERNWPIGDRELFACLHGLRTWGHYLRGREVRVFTDHAPLLSFFSGSELKPRHARWAGELSSDYHVKLEYHPGTSELLAAPDAISRFSALAAREEAPTLTVAAASPSSDARTPTIPLARFSEGLDEDPEFAAALLMLRAPAHKPPPDSVPWAIRRFRGLWTLAGGVLYFDNRVCVPPALRSTLLDEVHGSTFCGHFGVARTEARLRKHWYWRGLYKDVKRKVSRCLQCQKSKAAPAHTRGILDPLPVPHGNWHTISMDFVKCPDVGSYNQALIVVDSGSKFIAALPCHTTITAEEVAKLLWSQLFWIFGIPRVIISDRDKLFVSKLWDGLFRCMGTRLNMASTGHAQTDGQSERAVRTWTQAVRAACDGDPTRWVVVSKAICSAYNSAPHADTGIAPHVALFGQERPSPAVPPVPLNDAPSSVQEFLDVTESLRLRAHDHMIAARMREVARSERKNKHQKFEVGDTVLLDVNHASWIPGTAGNKPKFVPRWLGPYEVIRCLGDSAYRLKLPREAGRAHNSFHISFLRRHVPENGDEVDLDALDDDDDDTFEVDRIVGAVWKYDQWLYAVKFKDQSLANGHWIFESETSCPEAIKAFERRHATRIKRHETIDPPASFPPVPRHSRARAAAAGITLWGKE